MQNIKNVLFKSKLGASLSNLIEEASERGMKSKCLAVSYCGIVIMLLVNMFLVAGAGIMYIVGCFTSVEVNATALIQLIQSVKDVDMVFVTVFAIAITTTFGATVFGIQSPGASTNIETDGKVAEDSNAVKA